MESAKAPDGCRFPANILARVNRILVSLPTLKAESCEFDDSTVRPYLDSLSVRTAYGWASVGEDQEESDTYTQLVASVEDLFCLYFAYHRIVFDPDSGSAKYILETETSPIYQESAHRFVPSYRLWVERRSTTEVDLLENTVPGKPL